MGAETQPVNTSIPIVGNLVEVRQRRYLVEAVKTSAKTKLTTLTLACIDDDDQGKKLEVFWEKELDRKIIEADNWDKIAEKGFDPPEKFAAYLNTIRWNCVTATNSKLFQAPFRAGIKIETYQLEPLRRALQMPRVNLFIADDVGLGKTIEAGLIIRELLLRRKVNYVVVAAPPSMIPQWKSELENRFGLSFQIIDREFIRDLRKERGYAINPWSTNTRFLISQKLLIDESYMSGLRDLLASERMGSLFIMDEAHHAAPASGVKFAVDSELTKATRELAWLFEHRIFLSATPHNGHSNSFSALLEILDPHRFTRGIPVNPKLRQEVMIRRLKDDLRSVVGGLPVREVIQVDIADTGSEVPEIKLFELLNKYIELRERRLKASRKSIQNASTLVMSNLQQRLLSSVEAFYRTLRVHKKTVISSLEQQLKEVETEDTQQTLELLEQGVGADDDRALSDEETLALESDAQTISASKIGLGPKEGIEQEIRLLEDMETLANKSRGLPDQKILKLLEWIKEHQCPELGDSKSKNKKWTDKRVIIFTEWEDTKRYIKEQLQSAIEDTDQADKRIEVYQGSTSIEKRELIKKRFNADPEKEPLRILICTDAAREGLNLQKYCYNLFHFDVPWNPSRMEQRNGRIDRKLQESEAVFCYYFFYQARPEDRILEVLINKTKLIREQLGSLAEVIEDRLAQDLKGSIIRRKTIDDLYQKISDSQLDEERKKTYKAEYLDEDDRKDLISKNIQDLRKQLDSSMDWLGFSKDQFRQAVEVGLDVIKAPKLKKTEIRDHEAYLIETSEDSLTKKTSWLETIDQLREPMANERSVGEWRRSAPIRPIVFEDIGVMDDSVVHLHLEHKLSQRLLGRLLTQGFAHDDLSRSCFASSEDAVPKVVLIGRIALYGDRATRLHEEIVSVSSEWIEAKVRKGKKLKVEAEAASTKTKDSLFKAISKKKHSINKKVVETLQDGLNADIDDLKEPLLKKAHKHTEKAYADLEKRAQEESDNLKAIIERQIEAVQKFQQKLSNKDYAGTPYLPTFEEQLEAKEKEQLEANKRYWASRLQALKQELSDEPKKVKESYSVRATRFEPVGIVYLWPETN
ncbi:MAG: DEAD/DEAH box helicase family protein [Bdellovibrionales bacterium]|nr:DEAD/DEAH box helicase family protein [Bdellovibrionales bacterium]